MAYAWFKAITLLLYSYTKKILGKIGTTDFYLFFFLKRYFNLCSISLMCPCRICSQGTPPFKDLPSCSSWYISSLSIPAAMKIKFRKLVFLLQERGERVTKMQKEQANFWEKEAKSWSWSHHPVEAGKIFSLTPPYFEAAAWKCWQWQEWPIRDLCRDPQSDSHSPHQQSHVNPHLYIWFLDFQ